jgi:hypothetical protein
MGGIGARCSRNAQKNLSEYRFYIPKKLTGILIGHPRDDILMKYDKYDRKLSRGVSI